MPVSVKRQAVKKYFAPFPKWAAWLVGLGVVALVIGFNNQPALIFIGLIMTGAGGFGVYSFSTGKPTDAEMDKILAEDLLNAQTKALQGTGAEDITLEGDPVVVTGPRFWDTGGAPILFKKGGDNKLRFTPVNVTVLNMTEHQLLNYGELLEHLDRRILLPRRGLSFHQDDIEDGHPPEQGHRPVRRGTNLRSYYLRRHLTRNDSERPETDRDDGWRRNPYYGRRPCDRKCA
jgi:hypothetical protein